MKFVMTWKLILTVLLQCLDFEDEIWNYHRTRLRPIDITFTNPQTRNDFLHAYYQYDAKLVRMKIEPIKLKRKEEQHQDYLLRLLRNKFRSENVNVKYQVCNKLLMAKEPDSTWQIIEINESQLTNIEKELKSRRAS